MIIKIKNIEFKYENESVEPTGADVAYKLVLNDSELDGNITVTNKDFCNNLSNIQLWEFNRHIHKKIMESM